MNAQYSEQDILITRAQEVTWSIFCFILIVSNYISRFRSSVLSISPEERPPTPQLSCCSRHPLGSEKQEERSNAASFCKNDQHSEHTTVLSRLQWSVTSQTECPGCCMWLKTPSYCYQPTLTWPPDCLSLPDWFLAGWCRAPWVRGPFHSPAVCQASERSETAAASAGLHRYLYTPFIRHTRHDKYWILIVCHVQEMCRP